jgi:hypothetical protein
MRSGTSSDTRRVADFGVIWPSLTGPRKIMEGGFLRTQVAREEGDVCQSPFLTDYVHGNPGNVLTRDGADVY